jgi:hypothetical protein
MQRFLDSLEKAATTAAKHMQRDLRRAALKDGWDSDVVKNTFVEYDGEGYKVRVSTNHANQAFIHEFGSPSVRPNATIRKFDKPNNALAALSKGMKGKH